MTRKDYALIAEVIRNLDVDPETRRVISTKFMHALQAENPRFDSYKFGVAAVATV